MPFATPDPQRGPAHDTRSRPGVARQRTNGHYEPMDDDPKSIVLAMYDRLNTHDLDGSYDLFAEDILYTGWSEFRGVAEARDANETFFKGVPDHWRRVERLLVDGDVVATWVTLGGTPTVNGTPFEIEFCNVIEVRDGEIKSIRMYADWPSLASKVSA